MIILASKSPRRKKLMYEDITHDFIIKTYEIDEEASYKYPPIQAVEDIALRKCKEAVLFNPHNDILSADTIVVLNSEIIGKPKDKEDAFSILKKLSGNTHEVITAYCIYHEGKYTLNHVISKVTFNELSDELINDYIASGSPMDKAGAYGYQDNTDFAIVKSIKGSIKNIIGFPSDEILSDLNKLNILE